MPPQPSTEQTLRTENAELRARLEEAEEMLRAIRGGEVDLLVVEGDAGPRLLTLQEGRDAEQLRGRGEMIAQVSDAVIAVDLEQRITFLNAAAERLYGVQSGAMLGRKLTEIFARHWPSPEEEAAAWTALREHGEWQGQYLQRTHQGREVHVDSSFTALRDAHGEIIGYLSLIRDNTERRAVEDELRYREQLHRIAFDQAPTGMVFAGLDGRLIQVNARMCEITGYSAEELVGMKISDLTHPDDNESDAPLLESFLSGRTPLYENEKRYVCKGGIIRWVAVSARMVNDGAGRPLHTVAVIHDITARMEVEAALRLMSERLTLAVKCSQVVLWQQDLELRYTWLQNAAAGFEEPVAIGKRDADLMERAADAALTEALKREVIRSGISQRQEIQVQIAGVVRCYDLLVEPQRDAAGLISGITCAAIDITERKQAEDRLRASEARLRWVFESNVVGMIRWDLDRSLILDANAEFLRMTGYVRDDITSGRLNFRDLTPPEWTARNEEGIRAIREHGQAPPYEKEYFHKDGSRLPLIIAGTRFEDSPSEGMSFVMDLTEMKQAEAALRERTALLNGVLEGTTDVIFVKDLNGRMLLANAACAAAGRTTPEQIVGKTDEELFPPDVAAAIRQRDEAVLAGGSPVQFEELIPLAGEPRVCLTLKAPLRDGSGRIVGILGISRDITERKRAEEAVTRLAAVVESSHDALFGEDLDGIITSWNPGAEQIFGYRADEIVGTSILRLIPAARQHEEHELQRKLAAGDAGGTFEAIRLAKDGREFHASITISPLKNAGGKVTGTSRVVRDITERKQAEEALRTSEQRFRTLFESMDEGFCVIEMAFDEGGRASDYRVVELNPAFDKHTGMNGLLGRWVREAIPDLEEFWYETYGRVAATGEPTRFVRETAIRGGRWLDVYAFRLGAAGSNKVAILFNDITASRRAEETVRASEARNSFLVTLTDTLRPLSDPINAQAEASRVLGERLGANRVYYYEVGSDDYVIEQDYTNAALSMVGRYPISSFGPNPLAALRAGRTASEADVSALPARTQEEKAVFAGLDIRSYISVPLVKSGTFVAGLAVHADRVREWTPTEIAITEDTAERTWAAIERVRVEAALRESEARMRLATEATEVGIWEWNVLTGSLRWDAQMFRLYGVAPTADGLVSYETWSRAVLPEDLARQEAVLQETLRRCGRSTREFRILSADDGECRWIQAFETVRANEAGQAEWVIGTNLDVTAQKNAERAIREEAQRKDEFLAMLGHELRNPLNAIRHAVQISGETPEDAEACQWAANVIDRQSQQLSRMVDDLLDVARINRGRIDLRVEALDLGPVLEQAIAVVRPLLAQRRQTFTSDIGSPLRITGDAARLEQVFGNLLTNAAKYTPENGRISLRARNEDGEVVVTITDNGVGISAELLPHVFDLFRQADSTLDRALGGLGIGLSVVKSLIEMHLGRVTIASAGANAGTTVTVRLPLLLELPAAERPPAPRALDAAPSPILRVLIVDDHEDAAQALGRLLKRRGYEVRCAHTGPDGAALAREFHPEVLLLDLGLPGCDGYELARLLRAEAPFAEATFIAISGYAQDGDRQRCLAAGFDDHFAKPIDFPRLLEAIRAEADRRAAVPASPFADPESAAARPGAGHPDH